MKALVGLIRNIRKANLEKNKKCDYTQPIATWPYTSYLLEGPGRWICAMLNTRGCAWAHASGCSMCGYVYDTAMRDVPQEMIRKQFDAILERQKDIEGPLGVKFYSSGSFFDDGEIKEETREYILGKLGADPRVVKVVAESRPEYITEEKMEKANRCLNGKTLEVAVGLESSNDSVSDVINKGFGLKEFQEKAKIIKKCGAGLKAYVMLKPPLLDERSAVEDAVQTCIDAIEAGADTLSINPCNIQRGTLAEYLYDKREYRPPWLWSALEAVDRVKDYIDKNNKKTVLVCEPSAAGKDRGVHNCLKCNDAVKNALTEFSRTQDKRHLQVSGCKCKKIWEAEMQLV